MNVLEELESSLGCKPSDLVRRGQRAEHMDLQRLIGLRNGAPQPEPDHVRRIGVWPLISHHTFNAHNLFGMTAEGNLGKRTLTLLLAHHGVVASDPLVEVHRLWKQNQRPASLERLNIVIFQVAQVEPLIRRDLLRFESSRPAFTDAARETILKAFGVGPDFGKFTYLIEAFDAAEEIGGEFEWAYVQGAYELYDELNQECPPLRSARDALDAVTALGQALIQVSWQFAICSRNASCDIAIAGELEKGLLNVLLERWSREDKAPTAERVSESLTQTRHFERLSMGELPNIDSVGVSVKDAMALRRRDSFEEFRDTLNAAIDGYESKLLEGAPGQAAGHFKETMRSASRRLRKELPGGSARVLVEGSVPLTLSAVATQIPADVANSTTAALVTGVAAVLLQWAVKVKPTQGHQVAVRYCAELGAVGPKTNLWA